MSKLAKLRGDSQEVRIKDVVLEIKPLPFRTFTKAMEHYDSKENMKAVELMVFETLRRAIPKEGEEDGVSDEDLREETDSIPPNVILEIIRTIQVVNGLEGTVELKKE